MLDKQPRPNHLRLKIIDQNIYKQMMEPIDDIIFITVATHALHALADGFFCIMDGGFQKHLERYDAKQVDSVMQTLIEQMAETLSRQRGAV